MRGRIWIAGACALAAAVPVAIESPAAGAAMPTPLKQPTATGRGGGAATMSPYATQAAIDVLKDGGNAVDAAVAAAATLGVTEPFVAGPGGGGFFVYRRASDRKVFTIDGREKAPAGARPDMFLDAGGKPEDFETAVESGKSIGVPGQVATWAVALQHFGTRTLKRVFKPAEAVARQGFPLDQALVSAIAANKSKLAHFPAAAGLYLPGGQVPPVGYVLRNPDLAHTYARIGRHGWRWFYTGPIAKELANLVQHPSNSPGTGPVQPGTMTAGDMRNYTAPLRKPVTWKYRGYRLWGMAPPTSGGTTIGEAMNILENFDQGGDRTQALYRYMEASKLAYADRNQYVGDPDHVGVPIHGILSQAYANDRAKLIGPTAAPAPVASGNPWAYDGAGDPGANYRVAGGGVEQHTNHLVVADRWGNVVSYTNTIEQIAGSGMLLPNRGFLLNNELTDFNFPTGTANSVAPTKRPRSSMSPTIITRNGKLFEAVGSPGGATIITTVLQTVLDQLDFGMSLPQAIQSPRVSQANSAKATAEQGFIDRYGAGLSALGEQFTSTNYIGIAAGLRYLPRGRLQTASERWRGGGGSAMVVKP
ncbi:MAG: gamma-glutamyltranspeptidase / glutathione hydrolase [Solirubrobacteraceae bacterium]|jgi:gamma-glutamyltranspeptidase/glutathione hydrolase|nr:gamma-glutamyltranspeptidase / glutathione hydrolase [Solirubrobacteraceae bacterium]